MMQRLGFYLFNPIMIGTVHTLMRSQHAQLFECVQSFSLRSIEKLNPLFIRSLVKMLAFLAKLDLM